MRLVPAGPVGVVELVRQWARRTPDAVAATGVDGPLTHAALDRLRADVTAAVVAAVRATGGPADSPVAVVASRSATLPAVLLGVLGSGARWLLVDPADRSDRPARQVAAAGAAVVVHCPGASFPTGLAGLVTVGVEDCRPGPVAPVAPPAQRGYLMSTSGTTGAPALVATTEGPLAHFLRWYPARFRLGPGDATALLAGLAHDALLRDCLATTAVGGRVCAPPQPLLRDPAGLAAWLADAGVTVLHLTPQLGRLLTAAGRPLPRVRLVVSGGDRLTAADLPGLLALAPDAVLVNAYGTTETPQIHAFAVLPGAAADPLPVGHGAPGSELVVLAPDGRPAAVGETGEVVVRSRHLATGYRGPAGRADRFGPGPRGADPAERVYRTGDLGRRRADGAVLLTGRADDQVKVRGHRVEPAEVAAALLAHPGVADAAVLPRRDRTGETGLAGYVAPSRPGLTAAELRAFLATRLPEHARPSTVVLLAELPLTPAGKLDRARLPAPAGPTGPAGSPTERRVAAVWAEVLGLAAVAPTDNFFDIGGHSLAVLAVHRRLAGPAGTDLHPVDLFRYPTVRALAARLDGAHPSPALERAALRVAARAAAHRTTRGNAL